MIQETTQLAQDTVNNSLVEVALHKAIDIVTVEVNYIPENMVEI